MKNGTKVALVALAGILGAAAFLYSQVRQEMAALECVSERGGQAFEALRTLEKAERAHFDRTGRYTEDLAVLGVAAHAGPFIVGFAPGAGLPDHAVVTSDGFLAAAVGNIDDDPALYLATIDHTQKLVVVSDDCRRRR